MTKRGPNKLYSGGTAAGGAAATAAIIAQAIKVSGVIVKVRPEDFLLILEKIDQPLVVVSESKFLRTNYRYLVGYKGLAFFTESNDPLLLRNGIELVVAKKIWIPA